MALANRSSPLVIAIAALLFLAGAVTERGTGAAGALLRPLTTPLGAAGLAFLGWCLVSFAWSPFPALSGQVLSEFAVTVAGAYGVARLAPARMPAWGPPLAAGLLAGACLFIMASLALDLAPQQALGQRTALYMFNRSLLTVVLIAGPLAAVLALRGQRLAALALLGVCAVAILRSISGAAALGLLAGLLLFLVARLLPKRVGVSVAGAVLALAFALSPVEGDLLHRVMPEAAHERLIQSSSRARVAIAQSFGAAVRAAPWIGSGYGTGARFAEVPAAQSLGPEMHVMLGVGHPHNSFLQIWSELGLVGAILGALIGFLVVRAAAALPRRQCAVALGLLGTAVAVMFVEHGAWQGWWTAGCGAALAWLKVACTLRPREADRPAPATSQPSVSGSVR
ncbi:O-antigen ligase family protein [Methylobacterium sp. Leaf118]|uniref:O-antigen ligase family protein n=1 Tax=Methylobacterium sp. Leaf118 TaxID=2876562 RepID=UPI001E4677B4|nr:O-antigen ligase family protein [Methylobacterium sp. Leaf118]